MAALETIALLREAGVEIEGQGSTLSWGAAVFEGEPFIRQEFARDERGTFRKVDNVLVVPVDTGEVELHKRPGDGVDEAAGVAELRRSALKAGRIITRHLCGWA